MNYRKLSPLERATLIAFALLVAVLALLLTFRNRHP